MRLLKTKFRFSLMVFSLLFSANVFADLNEQPEVLEAKSRLEQTVTKKFRDRISTQIPIEMFNIGVQVTFDKDGDITGNSHPYSEIPEDVALGIIDKTSDSSLISKIKGAKIKKVEVLVGLHSKLGDEYKAKFTEWLKINVRSEFGSLGVAKVSDLPEIPPEITETKPTPPRQLNWEEKFGHFQNVIGLSIFAILFIAGLILFKMLPSKDVKEQIAVALRIQEMKNSQIQIEGRKETQKKVEKEKPAENQLNANLLFDNYRDHQKKVAFIAMSSQEQIDQVLDLWIEEGDAGKRKIASFVDAVLTHYGISRMNSGDIKEQMTWQLPEKIKSNKEMATAFREYALLPISEKTTYLEQSYWDLLSVKTLDERTLKPRFASLSQLSSGKIQKILSSQDKKVRALTVLHLPNEKMEQVISDMSFDDKKNIVLQAFEAPKIRENELEVLDESLKFLIKKEEHTEDGAIELQSMIPNLLMCLKPFEELKLVREICPGLTDKGFYLKQNYPSMAFLPEWPKEKVRLLLTGSPTQEILGLMQVFPEMNETILDVLPPRTKTILKDEIGKTSYQDEDLNQHLEGIKYKIFKMVNDGEIILTQMFKETLTQTTVKAA